MGLKYDEDGSVLVSVLRCTFDHHYGVWTPEEEYMHNLERWSDGKPFCY